MSKAKIILPTIIGTRTKQLGPVLTIWRQQNPGASWSHLIDEALKDKLKPFAGKRYAHLVN